MEDRQLAAIEDSAVAQVQRQIAGQIADSSQRVYTNNIRQFLDFVGNKPIWQVTREDLTAYRKHLVHKYPNTRTAQPKFAIVLRIFAEAMATPEIACLFPGGDPLKVTPGHSPATRIRGISMRDSGGTSKHRRIDSVAVRIMLSKIGSERDRLILTVLLYTGLRRSELAALKVGSIQPEGVYWKAVIVGKGNKKREIGIPAHVVEDVQHYMATRPGVTNDSPLFPSLRPNLNNPNWTHESHLSPDMVYAIVRRAGRLAGIENLTAHSTRVTFVTNALQHEVPIQDVALYVGHSNVATTQGYYKPDHLLRNSPAEKVRY